MQIKLLSILAFITMSGCFFSTDSKKEAVIVDKSTYQYAVNQTTKSTKSTTGAVFPVIGKVIKNFSKKHLGLTFNTKPKQAIYAIKGGIVVYSDSIPNHGKILTIKHKFGFYSTYTQVKNLQAYQGDFVKQGQIIAFTSEVDFYFAMKKFKTPIDPLKYLQ